MDYFAYKQKTSVGGSPSSYLYIPDAERITYKPHCVRAQFKTSETTLLSISLPTPPVTPQSQRRFSQPPAPSVSPRLHVLLVDDNPINLQILARLLRTHLPGVFEHIESVQSGVYALELLRLRPFDLVLMDIDMPLLNGVETTRRIRSDPPPFTRLIPIIAVTTNDSPRARRLYTECGMQACISKPILIHDLKSTLSRVLGLDLPAPPYTPE